MDNWVTSGDFQVHRCWQVDSDKSLLASIALYDIVSRVFQVDYTSIELTIIDNFFCSYFRTYTDVSGVFELQVPSSTLLALFFIIDQFYTVCNFLYSKAPYCDICSCLFFYFFVSVFALVAYFDSIELDPFFAVSRTISFTTTLSIQLISSITISTSIIRRVPQTSNIIIIIGICIWTTFSILLVNKEPSIAS